MQSAQNPYVETQTESAMNCTAFGWLLLIGGVILCGLAFTMDTSIATAIPYDLPGLPRSESVSNIGLMQRQMMMLHTGLALVISGLAGIFAAAVIRAIRAATQNAAESQKG